MKEKYKLVITIILFLIMIFLGASIIRNILYLIIKDKINKTLFYIIHVILIFILIEILFKTKGGKYIKEGVESIFKKRKRK